MTERNDEPTVLFTRRTGDLHAPDRESQEERLSALGLGAGVVAWGPVDSSEDQHGTLILVLLDTD